MAFAVEHFIERTPRDIWRIATDWVVAEYWLGVSKLRPLDGKAKVGKGTQLIFEVRGKGQLTTITTWQPPHRLGLKSTQGGITARYEYTFTEAAGGTRMQLEAGCTAEGRLWRLLVPVIGWMMERTDRRQLEALAKLVLATTGGKTGAS